MKNLFRTYVYPIATLAGSIIGVGFLSLPYIALKVGIWPMLFYFILLTIFMTGVHVIFAKISLKTPDHKRFPGFVGFYLGPWAELATLTTTILGSFGVLLVYCIIGGQFLSTMLMPLWKGSMTWYVVAFFCAGSILVYFGIKTISKVECVVLVLLFTALIVLCVGAFSGIHLKNIFSLQRSSFFSSWKTMFLPFGPIVFSLWGAGLIPEIEEMLIGKKKLLKKIIITGTLIPAVLYLAVIFLVLGISGSYTTESALVGLRYFVGPTIFSLALFVGAVTTFMAFITQGIFLKNVFMYDMHIKEFTAWFFTCMVPLILFLMGFNSFIPLVSFIGGVLLGINGIFILLMYKKIGGKNIVVYPLTTVFILGIIYELVYFIR